MPDTDSSLPTCWQIQPWQQMLRIFFVSYPDLKVYLEQNYEPADSLNPWQLQVRGRLIPEEWGQRYGMDDRLPPFPTMLRGTNLEMAMQTVIPRWLLWRSVCFRPDGAVLLENVERHGTWWPELRLP
jgi:hypothetical protein